AIENCRRRRDKCHGDSNYFVTGADASSKKRQMKRRGSAIDGHAMSYAAICCKTLFESSYFRTEDKLRPFNHSGHGRIDLWLDLPVLRFQVKKRYHCLLLIIAEGPRFRMGIREGNETTQLGKHS